jgi:hypothetical protein
MILQRLSSAICLVLALAFLISAAGQVRKHLVFLDGVAKSGRTNVPPTMYGEHSATAVACACQAIVALIYFWRSLRSAS